MMVGGSGKRKNKIGCEGIERKRMKKMWCEGGNLKKENGKDMV